MLLNKMFKKNFTVILMLVYSLWTEISNGQKVSNLMKNQTATLGGNVQFKCKITIEGKSNNLRYTWFKGDLLLDPNYDERITITTKPWGSKLQIRNLFDFDAGIYKCQASDRDKTRSSTAALLISNSSEDGEEDRLFNEKTSGYCQTYRGGLCSQYINGLRIYLKGFGQIELNKQVQNSLAHTNLNSMPEVCRKFAKFFFCLKTFQLCDYNDYDDIVRRNKLCQYCKKLEQSECFKGEFLEEHKKFIKSFVVATSCNEINLKSINECTAISEQQCYYNNGQGYNGQVNKAENGMDCAVWPPEWTSKYSPLKKGENFCRNPGGILSKPWCFVGSENTSKMICDIKKCEESSAAMFIVGSCTGFLLLAIVAALFFRRYCSRKSKKHKTEPNFSEKPLLYSKKDASLVPELNSNSIHLQMEIGRDDNCRVYKGEIINAERHGKYKVAIKTYSEDFCQIKAEDFNKEIKSFNGLNHSGITSFKGACFHSKFHYLVFEYPEHIDLHEYLVMNSPNSDVVNKSENFPMTCRSQLLDRMALAISSGLKYLSSKNYYHRDLAARNILVCENMEVKVCIVPFIKNAYMSSYYRTSLGTLLPIRWMAPEALKTESISDKSTIWSFGVLLWELYSYGLQPYCGYSNPEVLKMVSRRQLLSCPDQCPAKMYSLMHECWSAQAEQRPTYLSLYSKIRSFVGSTSATVDQAFQAKNRYNETTFINQPTYSPAQKNPNIQHLNKNCLKFQQSAQSSNTVLHSGNISSNSSSFNVENNLRHQRNFESSYLLTNKKLAIVSNSGIDGSLSQDSGLPIDDRNIASNSDFPILSRY